MFAIPPLLRVQAVIDVRIAGRRPAIPIRRELVEGEIGKNTRAAVLVFDQDLIHVAQNFLHSLQVNAPFRDVFRVHIFIVDRQEALRVTGRGGRTFLFVRFGGLGDLLGLTFRRAASLRSGKPSLR